MRRLLTSLALFAAAVTAAPPPTPTIAISNIDCLAGLCTFSVSADGLSSRKLYIVVGSSDTGDTYDSGARTPDADGNLDFDTGLVSTGTWTFTIVGANHNATPGKKELASADAVFADLI